MKSPNISSGRSEKAASSWLDGCNSMRNPWVLDDPEYQWGVNIVNRGGLIQTRPGYNLVLTLPPGNLQGFEVFTVDKTTTDASGDIIAIAEAGDYLVAAVDGIVYASEFPLTQPNDWSTRALPGIQFEKDAEFVVFCKAAKSLSTDTTGDVSLVNTYSVLMMEDGVSPACYWDGQLSAALDETAPNNQTPTGLWMAYSGNRLWIARGNAILASDLLDPLSFKERLSSTGRGDFLLPEEVTGLVNTIGLDRQQNLVAFTADSTYCFLSYVADRTTWSTTVGFQTNLYPSLGCIAGLSIVNHAGLLWWYSYGGLVSSDSATTAFLTSRIKYRDNEMARAKSQMSTQISGICTCSFESYLMVSIPAGGALVLGDGINTETMVLDYAIADELKSDLSVAPAWQGIWTGTRPIKWVTADVAGVQRCFHASIDYQSLNGSFNHIWEAFQTQRSDTYTTTDPSGIQTLVQNPIYCSFETKLYGDGLDLKSFKYAQINLAEINGTVNFRCDYRGTRGAYKNILSKQMIAVTENTMGNPTIQAMLDAGTMLVPQTRRLYTIDVTRDTTQGQNGNGLVESNLSDNVDRYFSLLMQWCGWCAVESFNIVIQPFTEKDNGFCEQDETTLNVVTQDGNSLVIQPPPTQVS